jgi:integrase
LEWRRVDLERQTTWLDQTKNGTPRGVPLNVDAVATLQGQIGKHGRYCFTYNGEPIRWELTNSAWHTWASWHRQAGTSCDELKDLDGWKSRVMVDRYAKYATEHLAVAASRIENGRGGNVIQLCTFSPHRTEQRASA